MEQENVQLRKCPAKKYPSILRNKMSNDLSLKYKDTLLLLLSIREKLEPEGIFHENISQWHYRIVYMDRKEIEFTRYLDDIKSSLRSSIPSRFLNKNNVKLQSITQFIRSFS